MKVYLGDSVYVDVNEERQLVLTTENGLPGDPSNTIYLESWVYWALVGYVHRTLVDVKPATPSESAEPAITVKHQPATSLPWAFDDARGAVHTGSLHIAHLTVRSGDADGPYIVHAANAYPLTVEALRAALPAMLETASHGGRLESRALIHRLLRALGEAE